MPPGTPTGSLLRWGGRKADIMVLNRTIKNKFPRQRTGRSLRAAEARNSHSLVVPPQVAALCKTVGLIVCLSPTGVCSFFPAHATGTPVSPDASCRRGTCFLGRARKQAKNPPGMRFPAPDSRRNGKSHIPGSTAFARTSTPRKKPGVLFNRTVNFMAGVSGAETSATRLQAAARGGLLFRLPPGALVRPAR